MTSRLFSAFVAALACLGVSVIARSQGTETVTIEIEQSASGSNPETPLFEIYQAIFSLLYTTRSAMPEDEMKESVLAFFRTIGLDDEAAEVLFPYTRDGMERQREYTESQVTYLCQQRANIESKRQVADVFVEIYDELDRMQEELWGEFEFLDDENSEILSGYAKMRGSRMQISPIDPHVAFGSSPETLDQLLQRICVGKQ
jgi:hypothetical protein